MYVWRCFHLIPTSYPSGISALSLIFTLTFYPEISSTKLIKIQTPYIWDHRLYISWETYFFSTLIYIPQINFLWPSRVKTWLIFFKVLPSLELHPSNLYKNFKFNIWPIPTPPTMFFILSLGLDIYEFCGSTWI